MAIVKKVKRVFKKARGKVIKRYFNKGYVPKLGQMYKDVKLVKGMLNAEKKSLTTTRTLDKVGQVNINATGALFLDITPIIGQGSGANQRTGDSIKICSAFLKFNFIELGNWAGMGRYRIEIFKVTGAPQTTGTISTQYYISDPISGVIDSNSVRDADFFGQYKKVYTKQLFFNSNYGSDNMNKSVTIKMKLDHHVRYATGTNTVADGQYMMVITGDNGNIGASNSTLTAGTIPTSIANSGFYVNTNFIWYFYDN